MHTMLFDPTDSTKTKFLILYMIYWISLSLSLFIVDLFVFMVDLWADLELLVFYGEFICFLFEVIKNILNLNKINFDYEYFL